MPDKPVARFRLSRESRLLLLTVGVCAVVLVLMARLRFPAPPPVDMAAPPLERLAARASYDALASDIERVDPSIAPNLIVLRVAPPAAPGPHDVRDALAESSSGVRHIAALRIGGDAAVATIPAGTRIEGIVGADAGGTASVVAMDPIRGIVRVRVPDAPVRPLPEISLSSLATPLYVVVVEGTQAGITVRPVFLGRNDRFGSTRWSRPLLPLGGIAVAPGALLFTLAGEFIGTVVIENGAAAVAGARDVIEAADRLGSAPSPEPAEIGVAVQPLTASLRAALRVDRGVVVSDVDPDGPAAGALQAGDVITRVGDWSTDDPDDLLLRIVTYPVGETVAMTVTRNGESRSVAITLRATEPEPAAAAPPIEFALERGVGSRVEAGRGPSIAGLEPGDLITRAGDTSAPTPAQLRKLLAEPTATGYLVLIVRRNGRQHIVAVPVGARSDAAAN